MSYIICIQLFLPIDFIMGNQKVISAKVVKFRIKGFLMVNNFNQT